MSKPRLTQELIDLLDVICSLVFADIGALAALTGTPTSTAYDKVDRLMRLGLVSSVPHQVGRLERTHRFFPTTQGIEKVATDRGPAPAEFWRERPIHPRVFRPLIQRLDALAMIYRLAASILAGTEYRSATVDHFIAGPYDAMIRLGSGPTIGIVRRGRRQTVGGFRVKWNDIVREKAGRTDVVLVLTAMATDWRYTYQQIVASPGPLAYCAREEQALNARRRIWGAPSDEALVVSLPDIVRKLPSKRGSSPASPPQLGPSRISLYPETLAAAHPAVHLTAAEKALLDVISDWPLVRRKLLPGLAGVSSARVSQMLPSLIDRNLVTPLTLNGRRCYALSEDGLRYVAYREPG